MPNGTKARPVKPTAGKKPKKPKKLKDLLKGTCGYWEIQFPKFPPQLVKGTIRETVGKKKVTRNRISLDNKVYFFPNPDNDCEDYAFIQFAKRTAKKLDDTGKEIGDLPQHAHDWQPDIEGWKDREPATFIDIGEIFYDPKLIERVGKHGWARRDGPGFVYNLGPAPQNLKVCWFFQIYVVCDGGSKVLGRLDFSFCISFNKARVPSLDFPDEGEAGYPKLKVICCNADDEFFKWVEKWHGHLDFEKLPKDDSARKKALKEWQDAVKRAGKGIKAPLNLPKKRTSYKTSVPDEYRYVLAPDETGKRYDNLITLDEEAEGESTDPKTCSDF